MNKSRTIMSISLSVFLLESTKGHLKWKVTDIEKNSKFSRSLIYRYMGKSKEEIMNSALSVFTSNFYGFSEEFKSLPFSDRIKKAREMVLLHPEVSVFYQKWRHQSGWIQEEFVKIEKKFQLKLKKLYPSLSADQILTLHSFIHGLVTAPFLNTEQASTAAKTLESLFKT